jgi:hypothetical protein
MFKRLVALMLGLTVLTGCGGMKIDDFKGKMPTLTLEEYFSGETRAWGLFQDRFGNVRRQFTVDIRGEWTPETQTLVLTEDFLYDDGETEQRVWTLRKTGPDSYEGTAPGVIGIAKGRIAGNAFNWQYDFDLKVGESTWRVHFDDWMFLQDGGALLNRATVSKWGFEIGTALIFFTRTDASQSAAAFRRAAE